MPIPDEYRDIMEKLQEATQRGRIKWKETNGAISVQLPEFSLEIWAGLDDRRDRDFVAVGVRLGKESSLADNWHVDLGDLHYDLMHGLWQMGIRQARGVPKELEKLRDLLEKGGEIGE